jgi:hypothetical protein
MSMVEAIIPRQEYKNDEGLAKKQKSNKMIVDRIHLSSLFEKNPYYKCWEKIPYTIIGVVGTFNPSALQVMQHKKEFNRTVNESYSIVLEKLKNKIDNTIFERLYNMAKKELDTAIAKRRIQMVANIPIQTNRLLVKKIFYYLLNQIKNTPNGEDFIKKLFNVNLSQLSNNSLVSLFENINIEDITEKMYQMYQWIKGVNEDLMFTLYPIYRLDKEKFHSIGLLAETFYYTDFLELNRKANNCRKLLNDNKALLRSITSINLSYANLTTLSPEIGLFTNVNHLILSHNKLEKLPNSIRNLKNLSYLDLSFNKIEKFPNAIVNLNELYTLNLAFNKIEKLPKSIGKLNKLRTLNLFYNNINRLPPSFDQLSNLWDLNLDAIELIENPDTENLPLKIRSTIQDHLAPLKKRIYHLLPGYVAAAIVAISTIAFGYLVRSFSSQFLPVLSGLA